MISVVLKDSIGWYWSFGQNKATKLVVIKRGKKVIDCICSDHIYTKSESMKCLINSINRTNEMLERRSRIW